MDIAGGLAAIATGLGIAKEIRNADVALSQAELKGRLADVTSSLAEAQQALVDAQDEINARDAEIARLQQQFEKHRHLVEIKGFHYDAGDNGEAQGHPYCPACIERERMFYRLDGTMGAKSCPNCRAVFRSAVRKPYPDERDR